ncbi:MAG: VanZ family protein [Agriterribacter sp.]
MNKRLFSIIILVVYYAILIKVMVFKDIPTIHIGSLRLRFSGVESGYPPNFIPFKTILSYLMGHKGSVISSINIIGNIALLIPIGFLLPLVYNKMNWKKTLVFAISAGLSIEVMQVVFNVGIFDIDDIILNALGVIIGYWASSVFLKWLHAKKYKKIILTTTIGVVAIGCGLYIFLPKIIRPANTQNSINDIHPNDSNNKELKTSQSSDDPCGGSGGTGQIIALGDNTLSIERNDKVIQTIKLTDETNFRTSIGAISKSELKVGERVTLIIDESKTASLVLVCNVAHSVNLPNK